MNTIAQPYQKGFRSLIAWKEAHTLVLMVYKCTARFPVHEKFALADQMQRAAVSVSANIAEGSGRSTVKGQNSFYVIARSSLIEVDNFVELAHDLSYIDDNTYRELLRQVNKV
jgi:four helix bundle protein